MSSTELPDIIQCAHADGEMNGEEGIIRSVVMHCRGTFILVVFRCFSEGTHIFISKRIGISWGHFVPYFT